VQKQKEQSTSYKPKAKPDRSSPRIPVLHKNDDAAAFISITFSIIAKLLRTVGFVRTWVEMNQAVFYAPVLAM
jgi:hypothetical protein